MEPRPGNEGYIHLNGPIDSDSAMDVIDHLNELAHMDAEERPEDIILFINSPGGSLPHTMQIVDTMRHMPFPVVTYGSGIVMSGGFALLMAGHPGYRCCSENTLLMSHQYTTGTEGKEHELKASVREFEIISEMYMRHYRRYTKKSEAYIRKNLLPAHDVFMTADEAQKHGIVDQVIRNSPK